MDPWCAASHARALGVLLRSIDLQRQVLTLLGVSETHSCHKKSFNR